MEDPKSVASLVSTLNSAEAVIPLSHRHGPRQAGQKTGSLISSLSSSHEHACSARCHTDDRFLYSSLNRRGSVN